MKVILLLILSTVVFSTHAEASIRCASTGNPPSVSLTQITYDGSFIVDIENNSQLEFVTQSTENNQNAYESSGHIHGESRDWPLGYFGLVIPVLPGKGTLTVTWGENAIPPTLPSEFYCFIKE